MLTSNLVAQYIVYLQIFENFCLRQNAYINMFSLSPLPLFAMASNVCKVFLLFRSHNCVDENKKFSNENLLLELN